MCVLGRGSGGGQQLCLKKWGALQVFCLYSKTWVAQGVTNLQESSVNELDWLKGRWWCTARRFAFRPWLQSLSARLVVAGNPSKKAFVQHSSDPLLVPSGLVPDAIEKITCSRESLLLGSRHTGSSDCPLRTLHLGSHPCSWRIGFYTISCCPRLPAQASDSRAPYPIVTSQPIIT